jgi:hypothetical protein
VSNRVWSSRGEEWELPTSRREKAGTDREGFLRALPFCLPCAFLGVLKFRVPDAAQRLFAVRRRAGTYTSPISSIELIGKILPMREGLVTPCRPRSHYDAEFPS